MSLARTLREALDLGHRRTPVLIEGDPHDPLVGPHRGITPAAVLVPVGVVVVGGTLGDVVVVVALALLVLVRHAPNLRRLVRGEEHSLRSPTDDGRRPER